MFIAAIVVAGTWFAARHLTHGEAHAESPVDKSVRTQEVASVSIDTPDSPRHERRLPITELRDLLSTKPGDLLDEQKLEADRRALQHALAAHGYLAATVEPASVTFKKNGAAYVVFDVERGPMFHVRTVAVTGARGEFANVVRVSTGDEAVSARFERARTSLAEITKSTVELHVREDLSTATVDIELATTP
jgi:hypothetical protein